MVNLMCAMPAFGWSKTDRRKGKESEKNVTRVAKKMGITVQDVSTQQEFKKTGIDLVFANILGPLFIQVKSSLTGMKKHRKKYPEIPVVNGQETDKKIRKSIFKIIKEEGEKKGKMGHSS